MRMRICIQEQNFQHCNENAVAFEITIQGQILQKFVLFGNSIEFTIQ